MIVTTVLALSLAAAPAGPDRAEEWRALIDSGDLGAARSRCTAWLEASDVRARVEGHKCLANVEVGLASRAAGAANADGRGGADAMLAGVRRGVKHLDAALQLAPDDLSVHQGRLHLLRMAGQLAELKVALEDSIRRHPGTDWLDAWKAYPREYHEAQQFEQAVLLYRVLDRHFPDDHTILSNMGAALAMLERDAEALECFQRAVKLSPDDAIDNWNLARLYDFMGRLDEAQRGYERALSLTRDDADRAAGTCVYAAFLEVKRGDRERACDLQRQAECPAQTACEGAPASR